MRFLTCVCTKIVRAFCVCMGHLTLTCTVGYKIWLASVLNMLEPVLNRVWYYEPRDFNPDCEQSLCFLSLWTGACEKLKEHAIERGKSDAFFLDLRNINWVNQHMVGLASLSWITWWKKDVTVSRRHERSCWYIYCLGIFFSVKVLLVL